MNKGLKHHIGGFIVFLIIAFICCYDNTVTNFMRVLLAVIFGFTQMFIWLNNDAMDYYDKES